MPGKSVQGGMSGSCASALIEQHIETISSVSVIKKDSRQSANGHTSEDEQFGVRHEPHSGVVVPLHPSLDPSRHRFKSSGRWSRLSCCGCWLCPTDQLDLQKNCLSGSLVELRQNVSPQERQTVEQRERREWQNRDYPSALSTISKARAHCLLASR